MELFSNTKVPGISPAMWRLIFNRITLWREAGKDGYDDCAFQLETDIESAILAHEAGTRMDRDEQD